MCKVTLEQTVFENYGKSIRISNGKVDIVVLVDVGPRIIRYGFCGQQNEFCDDAPDGRTQAASQPGILSDHI